MGKIKEDVYVCRTFEDFINNTVTKKVVRRAFDKGDKVWVYHGLSWRKGVIREVFHDNSYLVKIRGYGLSREEVAFIEERTGR